MVRPVEYEFILADGTKRYEIVYEQKDVFIFMKMHDAIIARPIQ